MRRKIFKTGNSLVVSLPKEMLESLNMGNDSYVSIELDRKKRQILIRDAGRPGADDLSETFSRQVDEFIQKYRSALEALAH